jgi:hypothetical protein
MSHSGLKIRIRLSNLNQQNTNSELEILDRKHPIGELSEQPKKRRRRTKKQIEADNELKKSTSSLNGSVSGGEEEEEFVTVNQQKKIHSNEYRLMKPRKFKYHPIQIKTLGGSFQIKIWHTNMPMQMNSNQMKTQEVTVDSPSIRVDTPDKVKRIEEDVLRKKEKPFICSFPGCTRSFGDQPGLTRHITVSHGERPFVCEYKGCDRRFYDAAKLRRHHGAHERLAQQQRLLTE